MILYIGYKNQAIQIANSIYARGVSETSIKLMAKKKMDNNGKNRNNHSKIRSNQFGIVVILR